MCGIAGVHLKNPGFVKEHAGLENFSNALLLGIESRGRRATGFVATKERGRGTVIEKADMCASDFIQVRQELPRGSRTVLLHTRLDTKGSPKKNENNHPVVCKSTFTTHNGSIYNDDELFESYSLERKAEVDSEIIPALINKTGLDKAEDALTCFQGALAIATIDPIRFPDQLLLAKGEYSPLVVLENDDFLVWASERKAIEEAWALVLGTPPKWKRYHHFSEGEFWLIKEDQSVVKAKYDVTSAWEERRRRREERRQQSRESGVQVTHVRHGQRSYPEYGWFGDWYDEETDYGSRHVSTPVSRPADKWTDREDLKEPVKALRKAGQGKVCIMGNAAPADIHAAARGHVVWVGCTGCGEKVLKDQITTTMSWGKMCEDCYVAAIRIARVQNNPRNLLTEDERRRINNWTKLEAMIHRKAISAIATEVSLSEETIEWLVFRAPATFTAKHKNANDLAAELDDRYQVETARLFEEHGISDSSDTAQTVERGTSEVVQRKDPFVNCAKHYSVFRASEGCEKCAKEFNKPESIFRSPEPDRVICRVCKQTGRIQRGKVRLGGLIYCNKHWKECHDGDSLKAVATGTDGSRYCHYCARGKKGLLFDGNHRNFGADFSHIP